MENLIVKVRNARGLRAWKLCGNIDRACQLFIAYHALPCHLLNLILQFIIIPARSIYAAVQSFILLQSSQATDWVAWHYNSEYELSLFANIFP